ncbi:MAG: CDP-diacylglycerol--serine O-phosphatidyltransferase [Cytophagaceae bacterium]
MKLHKHIPNTITCLNLLCGVLGILEATKGNLVNASYLIFLACLFDFLDGFAARLLKASSPIGKDLDSLADMVTFGVLPALIAIELIEATLTLNTPIPSILLGLPLAIPVFSALRLAKFNNDTRQSLSFIGIPTPENAIFIASLPLIFKNSPETYDFLNNLVPVPILIALLSIIMSFLLVSDISIFALKFSNFSIKENRIKYIFLILSALLLFFLNFSAIPMIVILHIILSAGEALMFKGINFNGK